MKIKDFFEKVLEYTVYTVIVIIILAIIAGLWYLDHVRFIW